MDKKKFQGYIFTQVDYDGNEFKVTIPNMDLTIPELLNHFASFLKGSGFYLPAIDNPIVVIDDETENSEVDKFLKEHKDLMEDVGSG